MSIAEQVATLNKSTRPGSIDMPLDLSHWDAAAMTQLHHWLRTCYDWEGSVERLFEMDITPESLAYEIVSGWEYVDHPGLQGYTWAVEDSSSDEVNAIEEVDLGDGAWEDCDGSSGTSAVSIPGPELEIPRICVAPVVEDPPCILGETHKKSSRRTPMGLPALQLDLSSKGTSRGFLDVPSPSSIFSPPPGSATKGVDDMNIGMAPYEVWSGKKAGFVRYKYSHEFYADPS